VFLIRKEARVFVERLELSRPIICSPKAMITKPAMIRNHGLEKTADPINPEAAPSETKIRDSPTLKASEFTITNGALTNAPRFAVSGGRC